MLLNAQKQVPIAQEYGSTISGWRSEAYQVRERRQGQGRAKHDARTSRRTNVLLHAQNLWSELIAVQ